VVIAIIGILAAMVFPVFARARESARKAVCLSNVKNIALAIQMYLADNNDTLPATEHRQEVHDYFILDPGGGDEWGDECIMGERANPYLRWAVVLDEYVKNRDVYRCPSAKLDSGPLFINAGPDWFQYLRDSEGAWGDDTDLCIKDNVYPPGWGGEVTDSVRQNRGTGAGHWDEAWGGAGDAAKVFKQSVGFNADTTWGMKLVEVQDPVRFVIVCDAGPWGEAMSIGNALYPDLCATECANSWCQDSWIEPCLDTIQSGCPNVYDCYLETHTRPQYLRDQTLLKRGTRHLGGVNFGFLDGHASWVNSQRFLDEWADETGRKPGIWPEAYGLAAWGHMSWVNCYGCWDADDPTLR
jgi:prepilin-type processing-associated H-X9-DG protein